MFRLLMVCLMLLGLGINPTLAGDYELIVESAKIKKTKASGKAWDAANGPPDPYVIATLLAADGKDRIATGKTAMKKDTVNPQWQERVLSVNVGDVVELEVWDKDVSSDDLIGKDQLTITKAMAEKGKVSRSFGQVEELRLTLRVRKVAAVKTTDTPEKAAKANRDSEAPLSREGTRTPPYYWAAFVLSGDWR